MKWLIITYTVFFCLSALAKDNFKVKAYHRVWGKDNLGPIKACIKAHEKVSKQCEKEGYSGAKHQENNKYVKSLGKKYCKVKTVCTNEHYPHLRRKISRRNSFDLRKRKSISLSKRSTEQNYY